LFAGIAVDKEKELRQFVKKTNFKYDIISDTSGYLKGKLGIRAFPTAVIINKKGNVVKILDDQYHGFENLRAELKKAAAGQGN
jgi:peroxiredoxin